MTKKTDFGKKTKLTMSFSLVAAVVGAVPSIAMASKPVNDPSTLIEASVEPQAERATRNLHARVDAAIKHLRTERPASRQADADIVHHAQWRNR